MVHEPYVGKYLSLYKSVFTSSCFLFAYTLYLKVLFTQTLSPSAIVNTSLFSKDFDIALIFDGGNQIGSHDLKVEENVY